MIQSDRWNVLAATPYALRTDRTELLDGPVLACEGAIVYAKHHHVSVWATLQAVRQVAHFRVPKLQVWGLESSRYAWAKVDVPFETLCFTVPVVPAPGRMRRATAVFPALEKITGEHGGKTIRVFGAHWDSRKDTWQLWSLRGMKRAAALRGIDIEIVRPKL